MAVGLSAETTVVVLAGDERVEAVVARGAVAVEERAAAAGLVAEDMVEAAAGAETEAAQAADLDPVHR